MQEAVERVLTTSEVRAPQRSGHRVFAGLALLGAPAVLLGATGIGDRFPSGTYLPLHTFIELFIALVASSCFTLQWFAADAPGPRDSRARFIGMSFLGAAIMEVAHTLVFPGMPGLLGPSSVERGIHYWLAARFWMNGALLAALWVPRHGTHPMLRRGPLTVAILLASAALVAIEVRLPASSGLLHVPGQGLTALKIALEAVSAALAAVAGVAWWRRYRATGDEAARAIAWALGLAVLAAICFTQYASAYDGFNLLGHVYAAAGALLILRALFAAAVVQPYVELERTTRELTASNAYLARLRGHIEGELASSIAALQEKSEAEQVARAELEAAIAAVPDGLVVYAPDGGIVSMNGAAERLLRYGSETRGLDLYARWAALQARFQDGKPLTPEANPVGRALRGETVQGLSLRIEPPGSRPRWLSVSAAPIHGAGGSIVGAVADLTDVTDLQQLQSEREDLLHAVSHDLRNPLQIVLLQAERLQRNLPEGAAKERRSADTIAVAARNMSTMIRDLVEAARMGSGRFTISPERVELARWIPDRLGMSAGVLDLTRVSFEFEPGLPAVRVDPDRLDRIIVNLVGNALKYSAPPAPVRVGARVVEGGFVQVWVADRGVGIAPEDLPRVFDRFYRGRLTTRADGLGLGLFIVRALVEAHGGRIDAESVPGEGSTLRFTLPVA